MNIDSAGQSVTWAMLHGQGFIGVLGAGLNGGSFLNYHEDFSSMLMATGFAIAVAAYATGLYIAASARTPTSSASL